MMLIYLSLDNTSQTNAKMDQKGLALPLVFSNWFYGFCIILRGCRLMVSETDISISLSLSKINVLYMYGTSVVLLKTWWVLMVRLVMIEYNTQKTHTEQNKIKQKKWICSSQRVFNMDPYLAHDPHPLLRVTVAGTPFCTTGTFEVAGQS